MDIPESILYQIFHNFDYYPINQMLKTRLKTAIRDVKNFPEEGIVFKDITPVLSDPELVRMVIMELKRLILGLNVDAIACVESRGFWFGTILAYEMGLPIIPVRKTGKLPHKTISVKYDLEYGSAILEAHQDAIAPETRVLIHDDLLATGGTANATAALIEQSGGEVAGFSFLVRLGFLNGHEKLRQHSDNIISLINYDN